MEIKCYSPVIIPTLNRYEHFKRCLDSLERCTGADKTDVYVGLDFPPSEKYVDGWKKIDEYLSKKEKENGFRHLYVRRRDHNCGIGKPDSNGALLLDEIREKTDRYIVSEDDNEFSPCFLEYINKALEIYKDDERVVSVCGYTPFDYDGEENVFFSHQLYAWGIGRWNSKNKNMGEFCSFGSLEMLLNDFQKSIKIYQYRPVILNRVLDQVFGKKIYNDVCYTCYCLLNEKYSIYPAITMVKNWGSDGTGVHSKKIDNSAFENRVIKRKLRSDATFEIDNVEVVERKIISKKMQSISSKNWYGDIAILFRYIVWRLTKKDVFAVRRIKRLK